MCGGKLKVPTRSWLLAPRCFHSQNKHPQNKSLPFQFRVTTGCKMIQFLLNHYGVVQPESRKLKSFLPFFPSVIYTHLSLCQASQRSRQPQCLLPVQNLLVSPLSTHPGPSFNTSQLPFQVSGRGHRRQTYFPKKPPQALPQPTECLGKY